jgi:dTDP-4-dehydrorhamnose reductase
LKILLVGKDGQVGRELANTLAAAGHVTATSRSDLDLVETDRVAQKVRDEKPDVVVNAAAYTAVDRAETERDLAYKVNAEAPGAMAAEAARLGALLVHFSTDYVFDGTKRDPYVEEDATNPLNAYGQSKLAGERAIVSSGCRHLILRTSWVYGPHGRNFMLTILRASRERPELRVVDDQFGAPTSSLAIARATATLLQRGAAGLYHLSAAGKTTWFGFAREILAKAGTPTPVVPITTDQYPAPARRPRNSVLDNSRLRAAYGVALPGWQEQLDEVLAAYER